MHSAPRDEHWLLDKFKFKLDLFTIGKILLKLIIFKKIVKFIALIGLLLFLPKLQTKHMGFMDLLAGGDDSDEETETNETIEKRSFDYCKPHISAFPFCLHSTAGASTLSIYPSAFSPRPPTSNQRGGALCQDRHPIVCRQTFDQLR